MAGDYTKFQRHYQSLTTDLAIVAITASYASVLPVRNSSFSVFIQKAELMVSTYLASTLTLVGSVTGNIYGRFDIPATAPTYGTEWPPLDFGPTGLQCVAGDSVNVVLSQVGVVGYLHIEAYQRYTVTGALNAQSGTPA